MRILTAGCWKQSGITLHIKHKGITFKIDADKYQKKLYIQNYSKHACM